MNYRYDVVINNKPFQIYVEEVGTNSYEHSLVYIDEVKKKKLVTVIENEDGKEFIDDYNTAIVMSLEESKPTEKQLATLIFEFKFYGRTWNLTYGTTPCSELPDKFPLPKHLQE